MKLFTCTELVMVLRAKIVAQSFTVDWLSKAPWVSINTTATYRRKGEVQDFHQGPSEPNGSCAPSERHIITHYVLSTGTP